MDPFSGTLGCPPDWGDPVLHGLLLNVDLCCGVDSKAADSGHVLVHVIGGSCDDVF